MKKSTAATINSLFRHKIKKSKLGFEAIEGVLNIHSIYGDNLNTDGCFKLWTHTFKNKSSIDKIITLGEVEKKGFKVRDIESSPFIKIKNSSKKSDSALYFNIADTTLPPELSYFGSIKKFSTNEYFINSIKKSFKESTGFDFIEDKGNTKIHIDFNSNSIQIPLGKNDSDRVKNIVVSGAIFNLCEGNMVLYNDIQSDVVKKNRLISNSTLVSKAVLKMANINKSSWIKPDDGKDYVWGKNNQQIFDYVDMINNNISKIISDLNFKNEVLHHNEIQKKLEINYSISNSSKVDYNPSTTISDSEKIELGNRTKDDILRDSDVIESVLSDLGVDYKYAGSNIDLFNLVNRGEIKKSPDATLYLSNDNCSYKNWLDDSKKGSFFNFVMDTKGVNFPEAVKYCVDKGNTTDYFKERLKEIEAYKAINKGSCVSNKDFLVKKVLEQFSGNLSENEYFNIHNMSIANLRKFEINKKNDLKKNIIYEVKPKKVYGCDSKLRNNKSSWIVSTQDINKNQAAINYLRNKRGLLKFPPELKVINGCSLNKETNKKYNLQGVGFVNRANCSDVKIIDNFRHGEPQSLGGKDITVLNEHLLNGSSDMNFIVAESQWDLVAFFNNDKCREVYDKSVSMILNGASSGIEEVVKIINIHKGQNASALLLGQADASSDNAMSKIEINISGGGMRKTSKVNYTNEEYNDKKDVNDLLKDSVDIFDRIESFGDEIDLTSAIAKRRVGMKL